MPRPTAFRPRADARSVRGMLAAVLASTAVAVGSLAALAPAGPSGAAATRVAGPCASTGLVVWLDTQGNGAAGTSYYQLQFTNLTGVACTLRGYPGVSGISVGGAQLGSAAVRTAGSRVRTITLRPGRTATATLGIVVAQNFTPSSCHVRTAAGLRVYAPNQTAAKAIPFPFAACARAGDRYLNVQAVKAS